MNSNQQKSDDDLGVKIGSKEEAGWRQVATDAETNIRDMKRGIEINEAVLELAGRRAEEEHAKFLKDEGKK